MNNIPAIQDWKTIFIDTSFIINCLANLSLIKVENPIYTSVLRSKALLDYYKLPNSPKVRWVVSSITASELTKFTDDDLLNQIASIFTSNDIEIINFTMREANFIVKDFTKFIEQKHINTYLSDFTKEMNSVGIFNAKNYISSDARIIACAKSRSCDAVITSDESTFYKIAKDLDLPVVLIKNLPIDLHNNIDHTVVININ